MSKRPTKFDEVLDGVRVRVYATRSEYEVVFNDDDIGDPNAYVMVYPKIGLPRDWAEQGLVQHETSLAGEDAGLTQYVATMLANRNDETYSDLTPEERFDAFLAWIDKELGAGQ